MFILFIHSIFSRSMRQAEVCDCVGSIPTKVAIEEFVSLDKLN